VRKISHHRSDIQSLRAFAVMLVIAGHLFPSIIKGGFIGVDLFFVISGFVITLQMSKLYTANPSTFLREFYSRRIKRILPSALLVTIASIVATSYFLGPVAANEAKLDGVWTTLFLGNFHFHTMALDYFATGTQPSPLQHYWSLSIEEQFYLLWPALFLLLTIKVKTQRVKQIFLLSVIVISLSSALYLAELKNEPIFFITTTRIWELAFGALLAISAISVRVPKILISLSLGVLLLSSILIAPTMQWPGFTGIPLVIAAGIILVNNPRLGQAGILNTRFFSYVGDLSYLLYLWHWPIFVIVKANSITFGATEKLSILLLTAVLSVLTHHYFENPIRFSSKSKPQSTIAIGISAVAVLSGVLFFTYQG
jgi:peptidoglycan/LPS O-acetylase OafA/YrhL